MENVKKLDNINLVLIFLLFISCISFDKNITGIKPLYEGITIILFGYSILRMSLVKNFKIKNYKFLLIYGLLIIWACLSMLWSIDQGYTKGTIINLVIAFLNAISLICFIDSKIKLKKVFKLYIAFLMYMSIILLFFETNAPGTSGYGVVVSLYFNSIAHMLAIGIFMTYYLFKSEKKKRYLLFIAVFYYIIFLTGSRKGLLFPIVSIIGIEILDKRISINKILKFLIFLGIICSIVLIVLNSNERMKERFSDMFLSLIGENVGDKSVEEREFFRETAKELFIHNPLTGIGAGCFAAYMEQINYSHVAYCHNNFLELLSTLGIVGFIIYYMIYYLIIKTSIYNIRQKRILDMIIPFVFIIVFAIFEYGIVSYYRFEYQPIICLFFIMSQLNRSEIERRTES